MDILGVPVYLSFLSLVCLVPFILAIVSAGFMFFIRDKTPNARSFVAAFLLTGTFIGTYGFATSVFHPLGAYHRWLTVGLVLPVLATVFFFLMTYSEDVMPVVTRRIFWVKLSISPLVTLIFAVRSTRVSPVFRVGGQFFDFDLQNESVAIGAIIISYGIAGLCACAFKARRMTNRRNARTFMVLVFLSYIVFSLPLSIMNALARAQVISIETHLWGMGLGAMISFCGLFVVFLSHTQERSTVVGNLIAVSLVTVLVLIPFFGYPVIEDRKASFREIWAAKLQAGSAQISDKKVVLIEGTFYRDNRPYYTAALQKLPSDGVILRADAAGGVYTFPVTIAGAEKIVGIELVELRKYIHPTAAKLVLAQFIVILAIVSLFPLFFRGILLTPMRRLLDGVIAISRGRYGHRIENQRSDELGVISRHFDKMAVTIEASTVKLEETVLERTAQLTAEKRKSDTLLLNILPERIANELKEKGHTQPARIDSATVVFTDFVGFTKISENLAPEEVVAELDKCFSYFDQVTEKYGLEKLKTIGDSFMCAGGVPEANRTHAIDACLAALEIQSFMNQMKEIKHQQGFPYWELRLGINSGPLVAGVVGHKKFAYDVWGDTVNTASRMESSGLAGEINISQSTYDLVQKWFVCEHRGQVCAKNKGEIDMYLLKRIRPEYCADPEGRVPSEKMKKEYVGVRMGRA